MSGGQWELVLKVEDIVGKYSQISGSMCMARDDKDRTAEDTLEITETKFKIVDHDVDMDFDPCTVCYQGEVVVTDKVELRASSNKVFTVERNSDSIRIHGAGFNYIKSISTHGRSDDETFVFPLASRVLP